MSPRVTVRARVQRPRGLSIGPLWLWAARIPQGPSLGAGRIAITDTPGAPAPKQQYVQDGQGRALVVGGVAFAVVRRRIIPL